MIDIHFIRRYKANKRLKEAIEEDKKRQWIIDEARELRKAFEREAKKHAEEDRKHLKEVVDKLEKTTAELGKRMDNLHGEFKKVFKACGDNTMAMSSLKDIQKSCAKQVKEYNTLKSKYSLVNNTLTELKRGLQAESEQRKEFESQQEAKLDELFNNLASSQGGEVNNFTTLGQFKIEDLHNAEDILRCVKSMEERTADIESKMDAVYNANMRARRIFSMDKPE